MTKQELTQAIESFLDNITQDITDVRKKRWLRTAIGSHTRYTFSRVASANDIDDIVFDWLCK